MRQRQVSGGVLVGAEEGAHRPVQRSPQRRRRRVLTLSSQVLDGHAEGQVLTQRVPPEVALLF